MASRERAKGRKSTSGRFAMLPRALLTCPAVATLEHAAFRVLVALTAQYNGRNNGALGLTRAQAREFGISSHDTLAKAVRALEARGLIVMTAQGSRAPPRPALFAITWRPMDDTAHSKATKTAAGTWRAWMPEARIENAS